MRPLALGASWTLLLPLISNPTCTRPLAMGNPWTVTALLHIHTKPLVELASVTSGVIPCPHPSEISHGGTLNADSVLTLTRPLTGVSWNYKETSSHLSGPRDEKRKTGTFGKFEGKRGRGRQREKIMDGLATWLGPGKVSDILATIKDRDLWRDMITNACKQGT
ncbi:hypothetical protein PoB_002280600 [Plakobranchus ocellatus]|uniref:Uncharacterized protein n=1 Tax=Plakobranchus ocellatus TaxID=259542 RepID=A0AAV3ZK07_9GAST|nr:hypothetical protein PoB_002280600 [Plakobranchus ocellatus]